MKLYELLSESAVTADTLEYRMPQTLKLRPFSSGNNLVNYQDRIMVVVEIGSIGIPFYISTGEGGKASVPVGHWYPIFGIGPNGWLNKGSEKSIMQFYGSSQLRRIAHVLDSTLGNLLGTDFSVIPSFKTADLAVVNRDLNPRNPPLTDQERNQMRAEINRVLASIGDQPHYAV